MAIVRTIRCAVCGASHTEEKEGDGFPGWGELRGVALDGEANPTLCPHHLSEATDFIDSMKQRIMRAN